MIYFFPLIQELNAQIAELQKQVDESEVKYTEERTDHEATREELESTKAQVGRITGYISGRARSLTQGRRFGYERYGWEEC